MLIIITALLTVIMFKIKHKANVLIVIVNVKLILLILIVLNLLKILYQNKQKSKLTIIRCNMRITDMIHKLKI